MRIRRAVWMGLGAQLTGCMTLDFFIHNNVPCPDVGPPTCEQKDSVFDQVCATCADDYDWAQEYPWHPTLLEEGQSVRPIDASYVQQVKIPTTDGAGELDAYFIAAHGEDPDRAKITLLYNHGNYAGIDHYRIRVRYLHELGFSVFVWDYRGYGKSTPHRIPEPAEWFDDADLVWEAAVDAAPDPEQVVVYGYSLGAIPGIEQALAHDPCALVLEAPFTGIEPIVEASGGLGMPGSMLTTGAYENREKIGAWTGPLYIMTGSEDDLFRVEHVREFASQATRARPKTVKVVEGAAHGISIAGVPALGLTAYAEMLDEAVAPCQP
jgi:alpha-beta hydrolase superfamily lysophospholipase